MQHTLQGWPHKPVQDCDQDGPMISSMVARSTAAKHSDRRLQATGTQRGYTRAFQHGLLLHTLHLAWTGGQTVPLGLRTWSAGAHSMCQWSACSGGDSALTWLCQGDPAAADARLTEPPAASGGPAGVALRLAMLAANRSQHNEKEVLGAAAQEGRPVTLCRAAYQHDGHGSDCIPQSHAPAGPWQADAQRPGPCP